jgi:O-antigen/teichoic acid export membrane protein
MNLITIVKSFFTGGHERTLRAKKNVVATFLSKGVSILISFIIVPLTLGYVGEVEYGIWMTIASIIAWFSFFDIGLGNGLRNKLAESLAKDDLETARVYVSSAFALITIIATILFIGFYIAANFISWNKVLNTDIVSNYELYKIVLVVFFFFSLGFIMKLLSSVLQAMQKYALNDLLSVIAQVLGLISIYILVKTTDSSLFYLCIVYGSKTAIVLTIATFILFNSRLKELKPSLKYVRFKKALPLLNLGLWFFINQILYLIVTQTSVFLVVQFFGPKEVTIYNLALRYMTIGSMLYIMMLTPFLSAFTEAYTKKEYEWIKTILKKLNAIWIVASLGTIVLMFGYKLFFFLWVGDKVNVPLNLIIVLGISAITKMYSATYTLFLNGIGVIKMQFIALLIQAILFVPISYVFYRFNYGLISVVLPVIFFSIGSSVLFKIQYSKIIKGVATNYWLK